MDNNDMPPLMDHNVRFYFDNIVDGSKDKTLLLWEALDTQTDEKVWIIGRRLPENKVLPLAILKPNSPSVVKRYAPANGDGTWNYEQIQKP
jgi:hypothetical protein